MAFGTMIGWGWIMLSGQWAADGGMLGAILAYAVGVVLCIVVGLVYAELTLAIPFTGGGVVFAYKSMGYWPSIIAGVSTALAYLGVAAWEGPAFSTAVNYVIPIPKIGHLWTIEGGRGLCFRLCSFHHRFGDHHHRKLSRRKISCRIPDHRHGWSGTGGHSVPERRRCFRRSGKYQAALY